VLQYAAAAFSYFKHGQNAQGTLVPKELPVKRNIILTGILALALVFGLTFTACGGKKDGGSSGGSSGADAKAAAAALKNAAPATDFNYELSEDGKGVVITGYTGKGGALVIPAVIEGLPVVRIDNNVFRGIVIREPGPGANLTSVVFPAGLTEIGGSAFDQCENLTTVVISASVKTLGNDVFNDCKNLTSVTFLGSGITLGIDCFQKCINLSELKFPDGEQAFILPPADSWGYISGINAFRDCTKLPLATRAKLKEWGFNI
jgi:hypothetical protein